MGRILVEMFRAAVNNNLTLVVEEVMRNVQLIIDDNGKSPIDRHYSSERTLITL